MRLKRIVILLVILAVIFGGIFAFIQFKNTMISKFLASHAHPVISVTAERVQEESWKGIVPTIGTLRAINGVDVTPEVAGVVQAIDFEAGKMVKKGDSLVRLDADIETANRNNALAQLKVLQDNLDRTSKLVVGREVSEQALNQIRFQMEAQRAAVDALNAQISKKTIAAPFNGRIGISNVDLGQYLEAGTKVATLQDVSSLKAEFNVSQKSLPQLAVGQAITVTADARPGVTLNGKLTSFDPRVDSSTGMIACEGLLGNPKAALLPGMFVDVNVETSQPQQVLTVSQAAISYNLFGDYVYVVKPPAKGAEQPTAHQVLVSLGERRGARVAVLKGIGKDDQVVTSGQLKLANGAPVKIDTTPLPTPNVAEQNY